MNLGLYGTLLDPDIRALVFGEAFREAGRPAILRGWQRYYVAGEVYPGIRRHSGARVGVHVLADIPAQALAKADMFEGGEYQRRSLPVTFSDGQTAEAMFYVPAQAVALGSRIWRYDHAWRARHHARFLREARAAMAGSHSVVRN